jgi:hypothetical protein
MSEGAHCELREREPKRCQLRRLAENPVYTRWDIVLREQALSPTCQQNDRHIRRCGLDGDGHGPTIDMGHTEVGDHHCETLAALLRRLKGLDAALPAVSDNHDVSVLLENVAHRLQHDRVIVHMAAAANAASQAKSAFLAVNTGMSSKAT